MLKSKGYESKSHHSKLINKYNTHTHTRLTALCPELPRWAGTRKAKPIWILLKQETVSGSGISWDICKSAPRSRQIITPAPHHSVFYKPDALPATQPTTSKHWRQKLTNVSLQNTHSELKDCTDRLMVTKPKHWMTTVNELLNIFTAPKNAVAPRRRAALVTATFQYSMLVSRSTHNWHFY